MDEEARRCSHSVASTDKSVCPEQQNIRNCQHDYKHDKLSPASGIMILFVLDTLDRYLFCASFIYSLVIV